MTGKLIISVDCEGRWGVADRGGKRLAGINNENLGRAYRQILTVLDRHNVRATFGFVAALCLEEEELLIAVRKCGDILSFAGNDWLAPARRSLEASLFSGWSAPELVSLVMTSGQHHICSHGGFHIPYDEKSVSPEAISEDISLVKQLESRHALNLDILIYPRNVVGFKGQLSEAGFRGYREIDRCELTSGIKGKIQRLSNEFLSRDRNDLVGFSYKEEQEMLGLSPGKFLNASIGVRKFVPVKAIMRRIDCLLDSAVKNGSAVHFYTHPHNFISDKNMVQKFDYLLGRARDYERQGKMSIATMGDELHEYAGL